ncbi:MAG: DAK2 domain-containing protein, partial [Chloroflexi bacterium]|nr:DAK2 domain-containing protein [Chloroflexota bacterium]
MVSRNPQTIDGELFRELVSAGTRCLEENVDAINALNVFPVPDGDTGINMLLTLKAANDSPELPPPGTGTVAEVSHALARGALLGARGNSGVIFSQFMKGLSSGLAGRDECDGPGLVAALAAASTASYQAVGKPVEGTMLTVMRAAAEAVESNDGTPSDVLRAALEGAERALEHTPEQLPILKEAGVVDAGGQGVVAFLAGALGLLDGTEAVLTIAVPEGGLTKAAASVTHEFLEHTEDELYGYCTQFIV